MTIANALKTMLLARGDSAVAAIINKKGDKRGNAGVMTRVYKMLEDGGINVDIDLAS